MGIKFQAYPRDDDSQIIIHVRMLDGEAALQQEALGIVGVNLVYGAFALNHEPELLVDSLLDGLSTARIEIDMIEFSGIAFRHVDNRLMSLKLVELGLSGAAMFAADGDVLQPSKFFYRKPILVERGSFRPVCNVNLDMLRSAHEKFSQLSDVNGKEVVQVMEITMRNLKAGGEMGFTNYAFSLSDTIIDNANGKTRGMFEATTYRRHRDVTDGLSNTIFMSEIRVDGEMIEWLDDAVLSIPKSYSKASNVKAITGNIPPAAPAFFGRGRRWVDGAPIFTGFNTILPPGDVSADHRDADDLTYGNFAAGSYHAGGGVNCAFGDGSIRFITAQVDCGDLSQPAPLGSDSLNSPYGVWGSLGTISADEVPQSD